MAGDTKERIIDVALELFAQSGYLGTSMSDIAKQLGITKGALYKHYTGKQEMKHRWGCFFLTRGASIVGL